MKLSSLLFLQGLYYLVTGLWPLFSMTSFEKITGEKKDRWLVKTIGLLLAVIGLALITARCEQMCIPPLVVLGVGSAAALAFIDIYYSSKKIISTVYLLDAFVEMIFIGAWSMLLLT